ncbi:unnamed protein product, partial [Owenia fusiformis]
TPCKNGGQCENSEPNKYRCVCPDGFSGRNCEIDVNDCSDQCKNGATCKDLVHDYQCLCMPGFMGHHCDIDIDECASNPCQNNGQCHDHIAGYQCICPRGFSGLQCQVDIDLCSPNPCKNGASCFNMDADYYCFCMEGFEGKNCSNRKNGQNFEVVDSCTISVASNESDGGTKLVSSSVCGNHGRCRSKPRGLYSCYCDPGFTGTYCHENVNDCSSSPCQNSGTCVDEVNSFQCICAEGWEGALCNLNKNDCSPNPCRNNGSCTDHIADFTCSCRGPWKGKTCSLRYSHCDSTTCANGGTCTDLGTTFACKCLPEWDGNTCQLAKNYTCDSSPCQNSGTCINSGDSFTCICKEGFTGAMCEENINDCNPYPCYNGGTCIDGVNWYLCKCPTGFAGPDCRHNLNECYTKPCSYGSTCLDGIGKFQCICPRGRSGPRCDQVIGVSPAPLPCTFQRRFYNDQSSWQHECNSCQCNNGKVQCTKIWCGPKNCLSHPNISEPVEICIPGQTCVVQTHQTCFTPPCLPWGQCKALDRITDPVPYGIDTTCIPNNDITPNSCAKITLIFDKSKMPTGISVEAICDHLRELPVLHSMLHQDELIILCDRQTGHSDTIEVTLSTKTTVVATSTEAEEEDTKPRTYLMTTVDKLSNYISRKLSNSSALAAVIEVKVETTYMNTTVHHGASYLIPLLCSIMGILGLIAIIIIILYHNRRRRKRPHRERGVHIRIEEQNNKLENVENEENLRRYRNPLFGTDKGGGTLKQSSQELIEIDLEKYEKSPCRRALGQKDTNNDASKNNPPMKLPRTPKNINVELSRTLTDRDERDLIA